MDRRYGRLGRLRRLGLVACWLVGLIILTGQRVAVFQNEETLWQDAVLKAPTRARGLINLGQVREAQARYPEAIELYRAAIRGTEIRPDHHAEIERVYAVANLVHALALSGEVDEAKRLFDREEMIRYRMAEVVQFAYATLELVQGKCEAGAQESLRQGTDQQGTLQQKRWICHSVPPRPY